VLHRRTAGMKCRGAVDVRTGGLKWSDLWRSIRSSALGRDVPESTQAFSSQLPIGFNNCDTGLVVSGASGTL
jgi:hypothetical protein